MKKRDIYIWMGIGAVVVAGWVLYQYLRGRGYLRVDCPGAEVRLVSGVFGSRALRADDGAVEVQARGYRMRRLTVTAKDGNGTWRLEGERPWGELEKITVGRGETAVIECGAPFTARADVNRSRDYVSVGYSLVGTAGEHYGRILKNGRQVEAPGVEIVDEAGQVLSSGKFTYG